MSEIRSLAQQFDDVIEAAEKKLRYGQRSFKDWTLKEKKASCYHVTGMFLTGKSLDGNFSRQPLYCNLCEHCYERKALKHEENFITIAEKAKQRHPDGVWRKKVVSAGKEAGALKKRISRNQDKMHMEIACTETTEEIWTLAIDEPGKNMDEIYGEPANPNEIDWHKVYEENRRNGSKVSYGTGLKPRVVSGEKEEKVKVPQPQLIVKAQDQKKAQDIVYRTNYMKEAETIEGVTKGLHTQFYRIMDNLRAANINVLGVKDVWVSVSTEKAIKDWNSNIKSWQQSKEMSNDPSLVKDKEGSEDFYNLLCYPPKKKSTIDIFSEDELADLARLGWK
jgi:hypothetical protein